MTVDSNRWVERLLLGGALVLSAVAALAALSAAQSVGELSDTVDRIEASDDSGLSPFDVEEALRQVLAEQQAVTPRGDHEARAAADLRRIGPALPSSLDSDVIDGSSPPASFTVEPGEAATVGDYTVKASKGVRLTAREREDADDGPTWCLAARGATGRTLYYNDTTAVVTAKPQGPCG